MDVDYAAFKRSSDGRTSQVGKWFFQRRCVHVRCVKAGSLKDADPDMRHSNSLPLSAMFQRHVTSTEGNKCFFMIIPKANERTFRSVKELKSLSGWRLFLF